MAYRALFLCGAAALALLLACEDDVTRPPVSTDPTPPTGAGGGSGIAEGGAPIGSSDAGVVCSNATITTTTVDQQSVSASPPTSTGGTIVDGTYDLELDQLYVGAGGLGVPSGVRTASTIVIRSGLFERVERVIDQAGIEAPTNQSGRLQIAGVNGTITFDCPLPAGEQVSFTAGTDGTLTFVFRTSNEARTYRRRL